MSAIEEDGDLVSVPDETEVRKNDIIDLDDGIYVLVTI